VVIELAVPADHHGVGRALGNGGETGLLQRLHHAGATAHQRRRPGLQHGRSGLRRGQHVGTVHLDAERGQLAHRGRQRRVRVVGEEDHPLPGGPEAGDRLVGPGQQRVAAPHHTVEVERPCHCVIVSGVIVSGSSCQGPVVLRMAGAPPLALRRCPLRSARRPPRRPRGAALRRHQPGPGRRSGRPQRAQRGPPRAAAGRARPRPLRRGRSPLVGMAPVRRAGRRPRAGPVRLPDGLP
jgi:hypothetical protein